MRFKIASAVLAVALAFSPLAVPTYFSDPPPVEKTDIPVGLEMTGQVVDVLMSAITRSKTPLPVWALEAANKAVTTWKLHKLSQKTAQIEKEVVAVLRIVGDLKDLMDAGHDLSEGEARFARAALQAHGRRLDDLTSRVDAIEQGTRQSEARIARLEADNRVLMAENKALQASNAKLTRRMLRDSCGAGRKRGANGCVDDPQ